MDRSTLWPVVERPATVIRIPPLIFDQYWRQSSVSYLWEDSTDKEISHANLWSRLTDHLLKERTVTRAFVNDNNYTRSTVLRSYIMWPQMHSIGTILHSNQHDNPSVFQLGHFCYLHSTFSVLDMWLVWMHICKFPDDPSGEIACLKTNSYSFHKITTIYKYIYSHYPKCTTLSTVFLMNCTVLNSLKHLELHLRL